jgi:hypothetical protein
VSRKTKTKIVRYLRNLSVSLLEGSRTSDLREFSKFRDFSENRSVIFPSALDTRLLLPGNTQESTRLTY